MRAWGDTAGEAIHTSTFLGNPLACAAALATLRELARADFGALANERERAIRRALEPLGLTVRGRGLLLVIELPTARDTRVHDDGGAEDRTALSEGRSRAVLASMRGLLERGFIVIPAGAPASVLSLTPPACLTDAQIRAFADALAQTIAELS